ncbi:MAG: hypothetical protein E4H02_01555 [Lentisphaerales bacterium]|nr:MAG: hypothetical protein E4H02_01555 [Lentisphaerales bacterium]
MRRLGIVSWVVFLVVCTAGCGGTTSSSLRTDRLERYPPPPGEQRLRSGDRITIRLLGATQNIIEEVIDETGDVKLPYIGSVQIGNLSTDEAENKIERAFVSNGIFKEGAIYVAVVPPASEFFIEGYVHRPGPYNFTRSITVTMAISTAGGPTEFAHDRVVYLVRGGQRMKLDMRRIRDREDLDPLVEPGDIIKVPRGMF